MTYDHYFKQRMPMCESKLKKILAKNANLINSLDQNKFHLLVRK